MPDPVRPGHDRSCCQSAGGHRPPRPRGTPQRRRLCHRRNGCESAEAALLLGVTWALAELLYLAPSPLHIELFLPDRRPRLRRSPHAWPPRRTRQQFGEARSSRNPVLSLGPVLTAVDQQDAIRRDSMTRVGDQACLDVWCERGILHVEPKLDGRRDFVDVLPARSRRAHEALFQLVRVDRSVVEALGHSRWSSGVGSRLGGQLTDVEPRRTKS